MRTGFTIGLFTSIVLLLVLGFGGQTGQAGRLPIPALATPAASGVSSRVVGQALPVEVERPELALTNVIIDPGAGIPSHHHPGTEIASLVSGELHYTVETGTVMLRRGEAAPDQIPVGSTVVLGPGDAVIESPDSFHRAENRGSEPVVIWLASLFPEGAPRTEFAATPTP